MQPPTVSIIVPCYNEAPTIQGLLHAIRAQSYPTGKMEVVIADGGSTDGTRAVIEAFAAEHPELAVRIVENPDRAIPAALNKAVNATRAEFVVRLDAHSKPAPDYVRRCLETLGRTGAANVGGPWGIQPGGNTWIARSIAAAAAHPLGAGDARYRTGGTEGEVDTVPFGAFRREWLEKVGPFNEALLSNEDYEYNARIRAAGGSVWFDPGIQSTYYARPALRALARQYARYGFWKAQMLRRFPRTLRWRQALPAAFVLGSLALAAAATFDGMARRLLLTGWGAYACGLILAGVHGAVVRKQAAHIIGLPLALFTMHLSWGLGAVWGLLSAIRDPKLGGE